MSPIFHDFWQLLKSGETVVAAVRSAESLKSALKDLGDVKDDMLIIKEGIDIVDPSKLKDELFKGVSNVIVCTGSSQRLEDAKEIYSLGKTWALVHQQTWA